MLTQRSSFAVALGALALVAAAHAAPAPFVAAQAPWLGSGSSIGVMLNATNDSLLVDTNGDGVAGGDHDQRYPRPAALPLGAQLRLSPSRGVLYASASAQVWFYRLPAVAGAAPELLDGPFAIPNGIANVGFFDQPGVSTQRLAHVVALPSLGVQQVYWFDLAAGGHSGTQFPLESSVDAVRYAPNGIEALVKSGVGSLSGTDWSLVSLCAGSRGTIDNPGGAGLTNVSGELTATLDYDAGPARIVVSGAALTLPVTFAPVDCTAPVAVGAACLSGGGCLDGVTQADALALGATWQGAGTSCATLASPCPQPPMANLYVSLATTGPAAQNEPLTYVISYGNSGTLSSGGTVLQDRVPSGCTFVRASAGGSYSAFAGTVTWFTGTLAAGAARAETLVVRPSCAVTSVVNTVCTLFGSPGGVAVASPLTMPVTAQSGAPVTLSVSLATSAPTPLHERDTLTWTVTLVNTSPSARNGLSFSTTIGQEAVLDGVLDAGTGTTTTTVNRVSWSGSLGPNATTHVVFRTHVTDCRSPQRTTLLLNDGQAISMTNTCGVSVGGVTPAAVALAPPQVGLEVVQVHAHNGGEAFDRTFVRWGEPIELELRLRNDAPFAFGTVSVQLSLPPGLPLSGTPTALPPGASWDAGTRTLQYLGALPAQASVVLPFVVTLDSLECVSQPYPSAMLGGCPFSTPRSLRIYGVPVPPASEHLVLLGRSNGLVTYDLATNTMRSFLCVESERYTGLDVAPNGTLWVAGRPSFRLQPWTLDFEFYDDFTWARPAPAWLSDGNMSEDVSLVPGTNEVDWLSQASGATALRRWDRATQAITTLLGDGVPPVTTAGTCMALDASGRIVLDAPGGLLWLDPAQPGTSQSWTVPGFAGTSAVATDLDGSFLAAENVYGSGNARRLARFDAASGAFSTLVPNLNAFVPADAVVTGLAVAPNADVYLVTEDGRFGVVHRGASPSGQLLGFGTSFVDLAWVPGMATAGVGEDQPRVTYANALAPVSPNPVRGRTRLQFSLAAAGRARIDVLDVQGRRAARVVEGSFAAGVHFVDWSGRDDAAQPLASGIYFVRLEAAGRSFLRRAIVLN